MVTTTTRPSICFVVQTTGFGGTEVHTLGLMEALVRRGYDIELVSCAPHWYHRLVEAVDWRDHVRIRHVELSVSTEDRAELDEWTRVLRAVDSRVLVLPKGEYRMGSVGFSRACRRAFDRRYAIEHLEAEELPRVPVRRLFGVLPLGFGLWRRRRRWERQRAAACFDRIVAVSHAVRNRLVDDWGIPASKIVVVHNGVRWQQLQRDPEAGRRWRDSYDVPGDVFVFGMLTRLSYWKAIPVALQAMKELLARRPARPSHLVIAGEGEQAGMLRSMAAELGVSAHVHFTGHTDDRVGALSAFDAILFSSIREGLPLSLLEGMAAGCVPIVTRISGMPEAVEVPATGWVVPPNDPPALAAAMAEALALDPAEFERRRQANVDRIQRHFDLDESYRRILDAFSL